MLAALDKLRPWMYEGRGSYRRVTAWCADLRRAYPCSRRGGPGPPPAGLSGGGRLSAGGRLAEIRHLSRDGGQLPRRLHPDLRRHRAGFPAPEAGAELSGTKRKGTLSFQAVRPANSGTGHDAPSGSVCREREIRLKDAVGRVAADVIAPYPPGVPVAPFGEVITEKIRAYLYDLCYDENSVIMIVKD